MNREPRRDAGELSGGYLKDIPKPHIRKYPKFGPRLVRIHIQRYSVGIHYSATIEEEDNPLWNRATRAEVDSYWEGTETGDEVIGWQESWDDDEARGRRFSSPRSVSRYWVWRWVQEMLDRHFQPEEDYEFRNIMTGGRWIYKEGD